MSSEPSSTVDPLTSTLEGFSIDSDEEEQLPEEAVHPLAITPPRSISDDSLLLDPTNNHNNNHHNNDDIVQPNVEPVQSVTNNNNISSSNNNAAPYDAFRAQTSRIASNLATMAQRGLQTVMNETNTVNHAHQQPVVPLVSTAGPIDNEQKMALLLQHVGTLYHGERIIMFLSNLLHVSDAAGTLFQHSNNVHAVMTYYRIIFFSANNNNSTTTTTTLQHCNSACWPTALTHKKVLQIPLASLEKVEKSVFPANNTTILGIVITGKDNARILRFTTASYPETLKAYEALQTYAFPGRRNLGYLFAFESKREQVLASIVTDPHMGHKTVTLTPTPKRYDAQREFQRQCRNPNNTPWAMWNQVNANYQLCPSYPNVLVGPKTLLEEQNNVEGTLHQCANFRSERRIPVLTWTSGIDGASLWRASQPKVGLQGNRSPADEILLKHILESAAAANALHPHPPPNPKIVAVFTGTNEATDFINGLKIMDLRPRSSAMANRTAGYGYENTSNYAGTSLQFYNIGNIHAVRDSYQKLSALCTSHNVADVQWNGLLEETKWLQHVRLLLAAAWEAAWAVHVHRQPVLLHCSHGWDRTSQVAALAQLFLDPYYRTRQGLACLIEKDFMSFGHPFHLRCGHGEGRGDENKQSTTDEGQMSPIFIQFLDCVYQIVAQYPECFEFNTKYLLIMSEHVYSCRFGTFLCDTERERETIAGIRQRTDSLWDYLEARSDTINPRYNSETGAGVLLMPLSTLLRNVRLWADRHCMYGAKPTLRWLPQGVERPENNNDASDHNMYVTEQENQLLLAEMPTDKDFTV